MTEDEKEMRFLAMDIKLFLRMAATHFTSAKDVVVLEKLSELAERWGAGQDIWHKDITESSSAERKRDWILKQKKSEP